MERQVNLVRKVSWVGLDLKASSVTREQRAASASQELLGTLAVPETSVPLDPVDNQDAKDRKDPAAQPEPLDSRVSAVPPARRAQLETKGLRARPETSGPLDCVDLPDLAEPQEIPEQPDTPERPDLLDSKDRPEHRDPPDRRESRVLLDDKDQLVSPASRDLPDLRVFQGVAATPVLWVIPDLLVALDLKDHKVSE